MPCMETETRTTLTELQRWAKQNGMAMAPNAINVLRGENIETAEQAAEIPNSVLLAMPWVKQNTVTVIRTWQQGRGIPVTPDPEPLPEAGDEVVKEKRRKIAVVALSAAVPYHSLVWPPQNEMERIAWETYMALLRPGDGVIARPGALEAVRQAWCAAEAWLRERNEAREREKASRRAAVEGEMAIVQGSVERADDDQKEL